METKIEEIWKDVVGYEGVYRINNHGKVIALGGRYGTTKNRVKKPSKTIYGYLRLNFCNNGVKKTIALHRAIAMAFIPNPENKPQINHKNGIKWDNRIENLEWVTQHENMRHALITGLMPKICGESRSRSKLKNKDVLKIRNRFKSGESNVSIARDYGVSATIISKIRNWVNYKTIK